MSVKNRLPALIGEKQAKENRVINVATVSQETGVSRQTIYTWLSSNPARFEASTIEAFCKYFQCGVNDLLVIVEDMPDAKQN